MGYQFAASGTKLPLDLAWSHPETGVQYPANWLRLSTDRDRELLGIVWTADTNANYDRKFYWAAGIPKQLNDQPEVDEDGNETGRTQTGLKTLWKAKQDEMAAVLLAPSDWRVVKELEVNSSFSAARTAYPSPWMTYRAAVRTACNTRQAEIDACEDVEALKDLLFGPQKIEQTDDDGNVVTETVTLQRQRTDDDGVGVTDDDGNPVMEDYSAEQSVMIANPNLATAWPDPVE